MKGKDETFRELRAIPMSIWSANDSGDELGSLGMEGKRAMILTPYAGLNGKEFVRARGLLEAELLVCSLQNASTTSFTRKCSGTNSTGMVLRYQKLAFVSLPSVFAAQLLTIPKDPP